MAPGEAMTMHTPESVQGRDGGWGGSRGTVPGSSGVVQLVCCTTELALS